MQTVNNVHSQDHKRGFAYQMKMVWCQNRAVTLLVIVSTVVAVLGSIGIFWDDRIVVGAPVWAKTTKFAISMAVYGATLLWMFSYIQRPNRFMKIFMSATGYILLLELGLVITQAIRGQAMHYNFSTPLDGTLYIIMTVGIYLLWGVSMVMGYIMLRQNLPGKALGWSIRLGLLISVLAGFGLGTLMTNPTASQMTKITSGAPDAGSIIGAHTVGAEDGGPGLPLLGWSTTHGDLRIPHFFGLHGLQVIPLIGLMVSRRREKWLSENHKLTLVIVATAGYVGFVGLVTWQALRAQSIIAPDGLTFIVLATLVMATLGSSGLIIGHARLTVKPDLLNPGEKQAYSSSS
ncbi:MAG: hypothetical protein AAF629_22260 [Chloroflexota bacterium]